MKTDKKRSEILSMFKALDELQPQQAQQVTSDYDVGFKAAYAINRTADHLDGPMKPLRKAEQAYQVKLQDLQSKLKDAKDPKKKKGPDPDKIKKEIEELHKTFDKDREDLLEELEKDVIIHQVDLSVVSSKCRVPAWWVWDSLRDLWTCEEAKDATYKLTLGDALDVRRAVSIYLFAPFPWYIEAQRQADPDSKLTAEDRFPVDVGWAFAAKLFWNAESIRRVALPYTDEVEEKRKLIDADGKESITQEAFTEWLDAKLEEVIEVPGLRPIKLDEFPTDKGTPVGAVMNGLMPIIEGE